MNIYLDMDGVLCDFVSGALEIHGRPDHKVTHWNFFEDWGMTEDEFWAPINAAGADFWANLKPYPWAQELVALVRDYDWNFMILTTPSDGQTCRPGKEKWLRRFFGNRMPMFAFGKNKEGHCSDRFDILVDDSDKNLEAWERAGGTAIGFPMPWNSYPLKNDPLGFVREKLEKAAIALTPLNIHRNVPTPIEQSPADGDIVVNERGGKQSHVAARLDLIPPENQLLLGECLAFGAKRYGEYNWHNISITENLNHLLVHVAKWLAGDRSEPHLVNVLARGHFALWNAIQDGEQPLEYIHPSMGKVPDDVEQRAIKAVAELSRELGETLYVSDSP